MSAILERGIQLAQFRPGPQEKSNPFDCDIRVNGVRVLAWNHSISSGPFSLIPFPMTNTKELAQVIKDGGQSAVLLDNFHATDVTENVSYPQRRNEDLFQLVDVLVDGQLVVLGDFISEYAQNRIVTDANMRQYAVLGGIVECAAGLGVVTGLGVHEHHRRRLKRRLPTKQLNRRDFLRLAGVSAAGAVVATGLSYFSTGTYGLAQARAINDCNEGNVFPSVVDEEDSHDTFARPFIATSKLGAIPNNEFAERNFSQPERLAIFGYAHLTPEVQNQLHQSHDVRALYERIIDREMKYLFANGLSREEVTDRISFLILNIASTAIARVVKTDDAFLFEPIPDASGEYFIIDERIIPSDLKKSRRKFDFYTKSLVQKTYNAFQRRTFT